MTIAPERQRLAVPPDPPKDPVAPSEAMREPKKMPGTTRVLVVEDDFLIAIQTEAALRDAGFQVIGPAATAEEAVALATDERPLLAVMDIRLASRRDGIDAARELFHDLNIRCIFATAHDDPRTCSDVRLVLILQNRARTLNCSIGTEQAPLLWSSPISVPFGHQLRADSVAKIFLLSCSS